MNLMITDLTVLKLIASASVVAHILFVLYLCVLHLACMLQCASCSKSVWILLVIPT